MIDRKAVLLTVISVSVVILLSCACCKGISGANEIANLAHGTKSMVAASTPSSKSTIADLTPGSRITELLNLTPTTPQSSTGSTPSSGVKFEFDQYAVFYLTGSNALIVCFYDLNPVGYIKFLPGTPGAPDETASWIDAPYVSFPISEFENVMNLLRYTNVTSIIAKGDEQGAGYILANKQKIGVT